MALIDDLRDSRATAITTYYNNFNLYLTKLEEDGDNTYISGDDDQFQAKYKAFNDLVNLYYNVLSHTNGYVTGYSLPNDEGSVGSTDWWKAVDTNNSTAPMYITNRDYAANRYSYFIMNNKDFPNRRDPYLLYNQYHTALGSFDNKGWRNSSSISNYTSTRNPLATGSNYRLAEPLEWWGDSNNLLWGRVVYDGYRKYRNGRLKNSYSIYSNSGFTKMHWEDHNPIDNRFETFDATNIWPSPHEIMRYSYYGDGSNTSKPDIKEIVSTTTSSFTIDGDVSFNWTIGNVYLTWDINNLNKWYVFRVTGLIVDSDDSGIETTYTTIIIIDNFNAVPQDPQDPPSTGDPYGLGVVEHPMVPEINKTALQGDAYDKLWGWIVNQHYTEFKAAADTITDKVNSIIAAVTSIIDYDYTIVVDEAGEELGLTKATTLRDDLESWLVSWKSKINDTGSGLTFSTVDSNWSNTNLDNLVNGTAGGLQDLIGFASSFDDVDRAGILGDFIKDVFTTILGDYNLGSSESWYPSVNNYTENNTGNLGSGQQIYVYRFEAIKSRIGRADGVLFVAWGAYKTWNAKLVEINSLESRMANITSDRKYDVTPVDVDATQEEDDVIELEWAAVTAASSYKIEYKEGLSGAWQIFENTYGYNDPGWIPEFNNPPPPGYEIEAYTRGYQELGLSFTNPDNSTGLADDFTIYDFKISIDGSQEETIKLKGLDCQTFEALRVSIEDQFDELEIEAEALIVGGDIRIASLSNGDGSTVLLVVGTINDLFTSLSTSIESPVDGTAVFSPGKTYHFRIKTNNGYGVSLGSDGNRNDKDWDSHSEYDFVNYLNDRASHGIIGYITWEAPEELLASGYPEDNDLIPSSDHVRVQWAPLINASSYIVYRSTKANGGYQNIGSTSDTYLIDSSGIPGVEYFYKVQGVADNNYQTYDEDGNLQGALVSEISAIPARGKRLWVEITAEASTDSLEKITVTWNALSGATGYILYKSNLKDGTYSFVEEDDGSEQIIRDTEFFDLTPAEQFFDNEFSDPTDGIQDYQPDIRYYFILTTDVIKQYYIESPTSGIWSAQDIVNQMNNAIQQKADDVICRLIKFTTPSLNYKIKLETRKAGESASVNISRGTFGTSLTDILIPKSPQAGGGALPAVEAWYKVQAIEEVDGLIVRRSEFSNKVMGKRPIEV